MTYIQILSSLSQKIKDDDSEWMPNSINAMRGAWGGLLALEFSNRHKRPHETNYTETLVETMNKRELLKTFEALTILHLTMCDVFDTLNRLRNISTYKETYEAIKKEARTIWNSDFKNKATMGRREKSVYNQHGQPTLKMGNTIGFISKLDGVSTIPLDNVFDINRFLTTLYDIIQKSQIIINALRNSRVSERKSAWLEQYDAIHIYDENLGKEFSKVTNTAQLDPIIFRNIPRERSTSESSTSSASSTLYGDSIVSNTDGEESNAENFAFQPITRERRSAESTPSPTNWQQYAEQRKINQERNTLKVHRSVMNEIVGKQQTRNRHTAVMKELEEKKKKIMNEQKQKKRDQVIQAKAAKNKAVQNLKTKFAENEAARRVAAETARKEAERKNHQVTTLSKSYNPYITLTEENIARSSLVGTNKHTQVVQQDAEKLNSKEYRIKQKEDHLRTILGAIDAAIDGLDNSIKEEEISIKEYKLGSRKEHLETLQQRIHKQISIKKNMGEAFDYIDKMYKKAELEFYSKLNQNIRSNSRIIALEKRVTQHFTHIDRNALIKRVNQQLVSLAIAITKLRTNDTEITPYFVKLVMKELPLGYKKGETPDLQLLEELRIALEISEKGVTHINMNKAQMIRIAQQEGGRHYSIRRIKNRMHSKQRTRKH